MPSFGRLRSVLANNFPDAISHFWWLRIILIFLRLSPQLFICIFKCPLFFSREPIFWIITFLTTHLFASETIIFSKLFVIQLWFIYLIETFAFLQCFQIFCFNAIALSSFDFLLIALFDGKVKERESRNQRNDILKTIFRIGFFKPEKCNRNPCNEIIWS